MAKKLFLVSFGSQHITRSNISAIVSRFAYQIQCQIVFRLAGEQPQPQPDRIVVVADETA